MSRERYRRRLFRHAGLAALLLAFSLVIGELGFWLLAGQKPIDALLTTAMLLGGMGPVGDILTTKGKLFASAFALYAGLVFIVAGALVITPTLHRWLHKFHIEEAEASSKKATKE